MDSPIGVGRMPIGQWYELGTSESRKPEIGTSEACTKAYSLPVTADGSCGGAPTDGSLCASAGDLTLLVHRAAQGLRCVIDRACRQEGLTDGRDWLVLTALDDGVRRTQLELARLLGIDKTTLTAVLDRLERDGHVIRTPDPNDRRARIPTSTDAGRRAWAAVARTRDDVERALLQDRTEQQLAEVRELLARLAEAGRTTAEPLAGAATT